MTTTDDTLVIGYGNPGRGDDGLGPALVEWLEELRIPGVRAVGAFQLQVEHAAELAASARAVFLDASVGGPLCELRPVEPVRSASFSTHSVSPGQVLGLARDVYGWEGDAFVLAMRGVVFDEFREGLSEAGEAALEAGFALLTPMLFRGRLHAQPAGRAGVRTRLSEGGTPWRTTSR